MNEKPRQSGGVFFDLRIALRAANEKNDKDFHVFALIRAQLLTLRAAL
jgi:hypothetical protein